MTDEQFNQILKRLSDIERHMGVISAYLSEDDGSSMDEAIARLEADAEPTDPIPKRPV